MSNCSCGGKRIRILVYAGSYPPRLGGYEIHLANVLSGMPSDEFKLTLLTPDVRRTMTNPSLETSTVRTIRLKAIGPPVGGVLIPLPTWQNLLGWFEELSGDYDLIWTHTRFFPTTLMGAIHSKLRGTRMVHTEHGGGHHAFRSHMMKCIGELFDHTVGLLVLSCAHLIIVVSATSDTFVRHIYPGAKTRIIPNGKPDGMQRYNRDVNLRTAMGFHPEDVVVSSAGRIEYSKGVHDLVTTVSELRESGYKMLRLLLIGDGSSRRDVEKLLHTDTMKITGQVNHDMALRMISASDMYVSASHHEGYGLTILEAASNGIPVIAARSGGISDEIVDGKDGLLFEAGDRRGLAHCIATLVDSPLTRKRLGEGAMIFSTRWPSWKDTVGRTVEALKHACATGSDDSSNG